jgi:regulatory protein
MNREESATPDERESTTPGARRSRGRRAARRSKHEVAPAFEAGTISALAALDNRGARFTLEIAGVSGIVSAELIGDYKLAVGRAIDSTSAASLTAAVQRLAVFDHAVAILSRRPRAERDLRVRLRRAGASDADVTAAIAQLQSLGLQNDAAYARHVAETRAAGARVSKRRVEQELRRKGVAADVASTAVNEALGDVGIDEETAALEAARKRARSLRNLEPAVARRRLYAFLARRGFASNLVARVVRSTLDAPDDD